MWVVPAPNRAAAEHHLILGQSPSLIREDILDLAQVFSDVESTALKGPVTSLVVHVQVPVEEVDLYELDYLNGDIERDRNYHLRGGDI